MIPFRRFAPLALFGAILVALAAHSCATKERAVEWEARADSALAVARQESALAASAAAAAAEAEARAVRLARSAEGRGAGVRERVVLLGGAGEPQSPAIAVRDTLIAQMDTVAREWEAAYREQVVATDSLKVSLGHLTVARDSLVSVLEDRPRPRSSWMPEIGAGPFVGVCTSGPCLGVGVSLTWRF